MIMLAKHSTLMVGVALLSVLVACDSAEDDEPASSLRPGPTPLRRLTRSQYDNTVRDLFGADVVPGATFPENAVRIGFSNDYELNSLDPGGAEGIMDAAEAVTAQVVPQLAQLTDCDPVSEGEDVCFDAYLSGLVGRVYRRPLEADEGETLRELFAMSRADNDYGDAVGMTLRAALQSPQFLYLHETGDPSTNSGGVVRLSDWEMASRLSYLFWNTMPDPALELAASAGALHTPSQIEEQARRMVAAPRARETVRRFHLEWLQLQGLRQTSKEDEAFSDELQGSMQQEAARFAEYVTFDGPGDLRTLLTSPSTMADGELAEFYGVEGTSDWSLVQLDPTQRAGLLTQSGFLAKHAHPGRTSPVLRGKFVRREVLCDNVPSPPPDVDVTLPSVDPNLSIRDQLAAHRTDPSCKGCHEMLDPIGYGFEHYDTVGRWRTMEGNLPVDASGLVLAPGDDFEFDGAIELAHWLAERPAVHRCFAAKWFQFSAGRRIGKEDETNVDQLAKIFGDDNLDITELMVGLTQTDAFLYRLEVE